MMQFAPVTRESLIAIAPHLRVRDVLEVFLFSNSTLADWAEQTAATAVAAWTVAIDGELVGAGGVLPTNDGQFVAWFAATPAVDTDPGRAALARLVVWCHRDFDALRPGLPLVAYVSPTRTEAEDMIRRLAYQPGETLTIHGAPFIRWQRSGE
jgi:hypothetical protein